ncbi:TetR/AcrR family transcriptional regulator [Corallococcus llansteffanensis]|uniref:TetR/AcrR family transcriptional regulator n=1 Tax=Corallococcus llansteffanensis TaxID=2316731 RepID=A0A3A8PQB5_9BACT|nr:TetR/AcrR family transcriptional regulator [Corallococcus llansteffanensis]RKH55875.1 TetR/AcrR family transcriptional regulator [Corallococcus llansteffanensis]
MEKERRSAVGERSRRAILDAALECFTRLGWAATTIEDIREVSGASVGSVYHHFGAKEGIAVALYIDCLRQHQEALRGRLERERDAEAFVRAVVVHHIAWSRAHPDAARYLIRMRRDEAVSAAEPEVQEATGDFVRDGYARLKEFAKEGQLLRLPTTAYMPLLLGPAQELLRSWATGRVELKAGIEKVLADAAWKSLRPESPSGRSS